MSGKKKLSKFFKDEKYSLLQKENIWLLCSGTHIIWVIGKRIDNRYIVSNKTKNILKATITQMKFISTLFLFIFLFGTGSYAQIHNPVSWETSVKKISDSDFELVISASIEEGWHLYSQNVPEGGPIPTSIKITEDSDNFQLVGQPF